MKKILLCIFLLGLLNLGKAQDGQLDSSFGNGGIVLTSIGVTDSSNNNDTYGERILLNQDGSMYLISGRSNADILNISKKTKDGETDLSYGKNGFATTLAVAGKSPAVLQPDGKIVIIGNVNEASSGIYSGVYRINTNGTLDSTFIGKGFKKSYDYSNYSYASDAAIQKDGKIVVAGYINKNYVSRYLLYRLNKDGSEDTLFTQVGKLTDSVEIYNTIVIQQDGKIVAGGYKKDALGNDVFTLSRRNADGSLDTSFKSTTGIPSGEFVFFRLTKNLIDGDGNILVAGTINGNFGIARFKNDGSFDTLVTTNFKSYNNTNYLRSAIIGTDGKIMLAGSAEDNAAVIASFNKDLSVNTDFSEGGKLLATSEGFLTGANFVTIQNDGKILLSGYITNGYYPNIAAARFNSNGTIDESFADKGKLHEVILQGNTVFYAVAVQNDGKVVAGGQGFNGSNLDFALARYNRNGSLDNSFSGNGKVMTDAGNPSSRNIIQAITIQTDDKIIAGGEGANSTALVRYNTNGSIEHDYGPAGNNSINNSIINQKDGKFIVDYRDGLKRYKNFDPDSSFNSVGYLRFPSINSYSLISLAIDLQKDGKIIVMGVTGELQTSSVILRYNTNGKLDSTFGINGIVVNHSIHTNEYATSICIQHDDKILVGGTFQDISKYESRISTIFRLNKNGSIDSSFNGGEILYPATDDGTDETNTIKVQNDDKIIIAGNSVSHGISYFKISRFNTDGSIDKTFNETGSVLTYPGGAYARISNIAIQGNNLYAAGYGIFPGRTGIIAKYRLCNAPEVLPLQINFEGQLQNNKTSLQWQVQNQQKLQYFTVEKSRDSINFTSIENITAKNNTLNASYATVDKNPFIGTNFYKLKLKNTDSSFTYSKLVTVNLVSAGTTLKITPNPAKNILMLNTNGENEKATLQFFDNSGMKRKEVVTTLNGANPINITMLPAGIYNLQINTKTSTQIIKFVKE